MKVYFAGKVTKNGWRQDILDLRYEMTYALDYEDRSLEDLIQNGIELHNDLIYNGPYVFGCDHGCFHGDGNHGLGAKIEYECGGNRPLSKDQIFKLCKTLIANSDAIFCYVDQMDAYGTVFELGYAHALNIPIYLYYSDELKVREIRDLWFVGESAVVQEQVECANEGFIHFMSHLPKSKATSRQAKIQTPPITQKTPTSAIHEPCTEPQKIYVQGLVQTTLTILNELNETPSEKPIQIPLKSFTPLTKGEAGKCINVLKPFVEAGKTITKLSKNISVFAYTESMKSADFIDVFSLEQEEALKSIQPLIPALAKRSISPILNRHRLHRKKHRPIHPNTLAKFSRTLESPKEEKPLDSRVKLRNRSKETFKPFQYLEQKRQFTKKVSEFLTEAVVKCEGELLSPSLLNQIDRLQLATQFLESDYCSKGFIPEQTELKTLNEDLSRYIDEMIPRIYAKYTLDLPKGPSYYDVDAEGFGLIRQFGEESSK